MNFHRDPVCGMQIDPKSTSARMEYKGVTYYFCNQDCLKLFKSYADKFVKIADDARSKGREF
jgi:YHS domain-containing protein